MDNTVLFVKGRAVNPTSYKNLIIGSGEGGKFLAWHLAQSGQPTAVVERRWIGGSCPNINCLPSKNEIWSAKVAHLMRHAGHFGTTIASAAIDMPAVRQRKRAMVSDLVQIHLDRYKATGAELIMGSARFTAPRTIEVRLNDGGARTLTADRTFLNLGTHASLPPVLGLADARPLTHIEILELDRVPDHLIIIGGGYVGLEFAQACRRFGSRVTLIQHGPQLLSGADPDVASEVLRLLTAEGITILLSTDILGVHGLSGSIVRLTIKTPAGPSTIEASDLLVATGRTPNTAGIGLELAGVQLNARGYIQVNDRLETTAPAVWALGECAGSPQFTHVSLDDFRVIRDNLAGHPRSTRGRLIPSCLYLDPPVAQIGLTENEAARQGMAFKIARIPIAAVLRTRTLDEMQGFMKVLVHSQDDRILGFTMVGPEAGEVMAVVQSAMLAGLPFTHLRDAIFAHPTMAEGLNVLFDRLQPVGSA